MKKIFTILILGLSLTACEDWLDIQPETEIREEKMFETEQGFKDILTGVYIRMATSSLYGTYTSMLLPEMMVQHWEADTDLQSQIQDFEWEETSAKSLLESIWLQYYQSIVNLNSIIEHIDEKESVFSNGNYELIKGEALGLRAFLHFEVLRFWGANPGDMVLGDIAIPYMKTVTKDPNLLVSVSYQEVLDAVEEDLLAAEALLVEDPILFHTFDVLNTPSQENNIILGDEFHYYRQVRFNLFAVKATLARYYLWQGDKATAAQYAMEVITAVESEESTPVFKLGLEADASAGNLTFPEEQIFAVSNSIATETLTSVFFSLYTAYTQDIAKLEEAYEVTVHTADIRYRDNRLWETKVNPSEFNYFKKYWETETTAVDDVPLIRLAEMYFIVTENGDVDTFRDYRVARGLDVSIDGSMTSEEEIMARLEKEYRKDFYGEGQMFFFYKRLGYEELTWPTTITMEKEKYKLPIPQTQTLFE